LNLNRTVINGRVVLEAGFAATAGGTGGGGGIGGDLLLRGADITHRPDDKQRLQRALDLFLAKIGGSGSGGVRFPFNRGGRLAGRRIDGNLKVAGATLIEDREDMAALEASGAEIRGSIFADNKFTCSGEVRLRQAKIGANLVLTGARLSNPAKDALNVYNADI